MQGYEMWSLIVSWFTSPTYRITVSYDSKFGNKDDKTYKGVKSVKKQNWKELSFIDKDNKTVTIRSNNGLHYRLEQE
jgi:hypothetical protein|tara:strand:- start:731 stop:961 length:231 start_codon:yes stop_codon:yes gene_type:complete